MKQDGCEWWQEEDEYNLYVTACNQSFVLNEGTPEKNGLKYCPFCGARLKQFLLEDKNVLEDLL